jgi:ABC-type polysaccharide/polyol phosphate export permease
VLGAIVDMGVGIARWRTSAAMAFQDIELRYKRSLLGPFWISASLVATMLALAFVFAEVFRQDFVEYIAFLGAGLLAWQLVLALVTEGCGAVIEHSAMLQNLRLPQSLIAGRLALRNAVIFAHNLVAVILVLLMFGVSFSPVALWALPGAMTILLFGYFAAIALSPICARFRDIPLVVQSLMQVIFFLTPIFWMPSAVSHRPMFTQANPFYHMIELVRAPLLGHEALAINWQVALWCCVGAAFAAIVVSSLTYKRISLWL